MRLRASGHQASGHPTMNSINASRRVSRRQVGRRVSRSRPILDPEKIEKRSFEIIEGLLKGSGLSGPRKDIVKRVIHTTTDPTYAEELCFHPKAVGAGLKAIKNGKDVICDVGMVKAGINKKILSSFGGKVVCLIDDEDVINNASRFGISRAIAAMRKAAKFIDGSIAVIGNAPTALFELCDMVRRKKVKPALIIGIPVGFVGAVEAKERLRGLAGVPYITNRNTKGGSAVAAAIINALLHLSKQTA